MTKLIKIARCTHCGSTNVLFEAYSVWDVDAQDFQLHQTFSEAAYCDSDECGGSETAIVWGGISND